MTLIEKKPLNLVEKLKKKPYNQLVKKFFKLDKKIKKKIKSLINRKFFKLNENIKKKSIIYYFIILFSKR